MTLTSFALMFLLILVRSVLTFLFGRFGKAIPPPPYPAIGFKPAIKIFINMRCYGKRVFHLPLFGVVDYKTTLRNAIKKCNKNKFLTGYYLKTCRFQEDFPSYGYYRVRKKVLKKALRWSLNKPKNNAFSASFKTRPKKMFVIHDYFTALSISI